MTIAAHELYRRDVRAGRRVQVIDEPVLVEGEPLLAIVSTLEKPEVEERRVQYDAETVDDVEYETRGALAILRCVDVDAQDVEKEADEEDTEPDQRDGTVFRFAPLKLKLNSPY